MSKEQYLAQHGERKEKLLTLLHDVQTFMTAQGKEGDAQALEKLQNNIEHGLFSIVLIGEFSAGKSTFLNALMQKRILPSYTRETTATVNFLQHASKAPNGEPGIVYYRDGRTEVLPDLSVDTLTKYVTVGEGEKRNAVSESTERVDLFLKSRFLEDGVMLVDSPGLNGITENLEDITRRQIKESHASIFMFSADRPGSKTDFDTLRDLRAQCSRIFIVLNKIDAIKANEGESVESVVQHLKDSYAEQFEGAPLPEIYPISAHQALVARDADYEDPRQPNKDTAYCARMEESSRLHAFEDRLWRYITNGEKTREELMAPVHTVLHMLHDERSALDTSIDVLSAQHSPDDLIKQQDEMKDKIEELRREEQAQRSPLRKRFKEVMRDVRERASDYCARVVARVAEEAGDIEDTDELRAYADDLQRKLDGEYRRRLQRMDDDLREELVLVTDEISGQVLEGVQEILSAIPGIDLNISATAFQMTEMEVGSRMEAAEREFAEKRKEMERIEEELHRQEKGKLAARRIEQKRAALEQDLRELSERRHHIETMFEIPAVHKYRQETIIKRNREGVFGKIAQVFMGRKQDVETVEYVDDTAQVAALAERQARLNSISAERAELLSMMEQYREPDVCSEEFDIEVQRCNRRLEELHKDYLESMQKYTERLEKDAARARKRIMREIIRYAENRGDEFNRAVDSGLKEMAQQSYEAVRGMVTARVTDEIRRYEERLNRLIEDCKASDAERDAKLAQAQAARESAIELLSRCAELEQELQQMQDTIGEAE